MNRKTCIGCIHYQPLSVSVPTEKVCLYILDTGKKRNCSPEHCDKYTRGISKSKKTQLILNPKRKQPVNIDEMVDIILSK